MNPTKEIITEIRKGFALLCATTQWCHCKHGEDDTLCDDYKMFYDILSEGFPRVESIHDDYVECLECGKRFTSLTKHLKRTHGIKEEEYKEKHGIAKGTKLVARKHTEKMRAVGKENSNR